MARRKNRTTSAGAPVPFRGLAVLSVIGAAVFGVLAGSGHAQGRDPLGDRANELRFGLVTTLRHDSNETLSAVRAGSVTRFDTDLSFGATWHSPVSLLDVNASAVLRHTDGRTGAGTDAEISGLRLFYRRDTARADISAHARFDTTDLSSLSTLVDPVTGDLLLVSDPGQRRAFSTGVVLRLGRDGPAVTTIKVDRAGTRYANTLSPSYYDSDRWRASVSTVWRLSPVADLTTGFSVASYRARDPAATRRETTKADVSVSYALDRITTLTASLGYMRFDQSGAATLRTRDGLTLGLGLTRGRSTGQIGLSYDRSIDTTGARDRIAVSAEYDLPRGRLSGMLGYATRQVRGGTGGEVIGRLDYRHSLAQGQLTLGAERGITTSDTGVDRLTTQIRAGFGYQVTSSTGINLSAAYSQIDAATPGTGDTARTTFGVSFTRQLTRDWALTGGIQHRIARRQGLGDASSDAVYVSVGRDFSFRF